MLRKISIHRIVNNRFLSVAPVTGVRKNHEFNVSSLNEYLKLIGLQDLQTGTIEIKQFSHGQSNPTFLVVTSSGKKYTVRKQPPGQLLAGAHAVDREFTVMTALKKTNVKVPTTRVYCDDSSIIGSPFFIYGIVYYCH
jgi:aminoglycoside phosphotransferase (APT) family kinase protein